MAIAQGKSVIKTEQLTLHTKTAIYVAELMANVKFHVEACDNSTVTIECEGLAVKNTSL
jgi:RNA 3'-terminal phosphate cyclase (ATP)